MVARGRHLHFQVCVIRESILQKDPVVRLTDTDLPRTAQSFRTNTKVPRPAQAGAQFLGSNGPRRSVSGTCASVQTDQEELK